MMKRMTALLLCLCLLPLVALAEAPKAEEKEEEVIQITEENFEEMIELVEHETDEYIERLIHLEGMFRTSHPNVGPDFYMVYRYGKSCHSDNGPIGFEVKLAEGMDVPEDNAWVEIEGRLQWYEEDGSRFIALFLTSMTEKETRGIESFVEGK